MSKIPSDGILESLYNLRIRESDRAQKHEHTPPHLLHQSYHEVEVWRRREVSEAKVTVGPFFGNRANIVKCSCTRTSCEYWRPPECPLLKERVVIWRQISVSALMNNWKAEKELHLKEEKIWQECFSFCEKCIAIGWCNSRFRCNRYSR